MLAALFSHPEPKGRIRPIDLLLAAGFTVAGIAPILISELAMALDPELVENVKNTDLNIPYLIILVILQGVFQLIWRFSLPWCIGLVMGVQILISIELLAEGLLFSSAAYALYLLGKHYTTRRAFMFTAAAIALDFIAKVLVTTLQDGILMLTAVVWIATSLLSYISPVIFGMWIQSKNQYQQLVSENAAKEYKTKLDSALVSERQRLAGELHDVAAHHLAGIAVQAAAIKSLIDRDPATAKEAAQQLRQQAKEALSGMRQVVGLLQEGNGAPTLKDIPDLITATEALGIDIDLNMPTSLPSLPQPVDFAMYRTVQQAISNALQHAPGSWLRVEVTEQEQMLEITVTNGPAQREAVLPSGGTGLNLMRERTIRYGGKFSANPTTAGGWQVRVSVPIDSVASTITPTDAFKGAMR